MTTIIKSYGASGDNASVRGAAFNLDDIAEKANQYLADVRRQADAILAKARDEAAELRRQASEQGRAEALKTAHQQTAAKSQKELEQRLQTLLPALSAAIKEIQQAQTTWRAHWEKKAIQLAVAIAARIVRREIAQSPEITLELMRETLELAAGSGRITLGLNERDLVTLGDKAQMLVSQASKDIGIELVVDAEVPPGGCRAITEFGEVDHRLESQLARIEEELTG
jgi:flagellar assembly protein FliH